MLTIADMLELREKYKAEADLLLLKASVLTDLISLAETKEPVVTETIEVQTLVDFPAQTEGQTTDESY
jgi:hypothetical protein